MVFILDQALHNTLVGETENTLSTTISAGSTYLAKWNRRIGLILRIYRLVAITLQRKIIIHPANWRGGRTPRLPFGSTIGLFRAGASQQGPLSPSVSGSFSIACASVWIGPRRKKG